MQIQELGQAFFNKIQDSQTETHQTLSSLFVNQELSIKKKLQERFQTLMMQFHPQKDSPTRKKQSILQEDSEMESEVENIRPATDTTIAKDNATNTRTEHTNPYSKSTLQLRSVPETLPIVK
jgi:hypothetical protein